MSQIQVRINGRGNAWPIVIGQEHPFYNRSNIEDLANASCSILKTSFENPSENDINWELMVDAGHGAVQNLIKNSNRIPDALFLTHPHIDHTLGIDWIVQSYYKTHKKPYPIYGTSLCWKKTVVAFPQLQEIVTFKKLVPYKEIIIDEINDVSLIPFPVYHGQSAEGAVMFYFRVKDGNDERKVLITGDVLCPLLRNQDFETISGVDLLIADANNRFPYPKSNHWSILKGVNNHISERLTEFIKETMFGTILFPHIKYNISDNYSRSFDYFLNKEIKVSEFIFTIEEFVKIIKPKKTALIHYSGNEDEKYYQMSRLGEVELKEWLYNTVLELELPTEFIVPYVGQHMNFIKH